jgi:hypothetical protein
MAIRLKHKRFLLKAAAVGAGALMVGCSNDVVATSPGALSGDSDSGALDGRVGLGPFDGGSTLDGPVGLGPLPPTVAARSTVRSGSLPRMAAGCSTGPSV